MNGKERAAYRKQANTLNAIFQIGKEGVSDALTESVGQALDKRELIKLSVLESCELSAKEAAQALSEATGSEVITCIGRKFVLWRKAPDKEENA